MKNFLSQLRNGKSITVGEHTKFFATMAPCGAYSFPLKDQHVSQHPKASTRFGLKAAPENYRHGDTKQT